MILRELLPGAHAEQKFDIAAGLLQLIEHQLHRFHRRYAGQGATEHDDLTLLVLQAES